MDYDLLNRIEDVIKACCVGGAEGKYSLDYEESPVADLIAYHLGKTLEGVEISDKDFTMITVNVQSGLAMAAAKAMRILGASNAIGVVTHEKERQGQMIWQRHSGRRLQQKKSCSINCMTW